MSCKISPFLGKDEVILKENRFVIKNGSDVRDQRALKGQLYYLSKQRPISNTLQFREWVWFKTSKPSDTSQFKRWVRSTFAEEPARYLDSLSLASTHNMRVFMQERGFFNADVSHSVKYSKGRAFVSYSINPGRQYIVESLTFQSQDSTIATLLQNSISLSNLRPGKPLEINAYNQEVKRIVNYLQDLGYAEFNLKDISPIITDTSSAFDQFTSKGLQPKIPVILEIQRPDESSFHQRYQVGQINCYPNHYPGLNLTNTHQVNINGVQFYSKDSVFSVKPERIRECIYIKPGELTTRFAIDKSYQRLNRLGLYKYINIKQNRDSLNESLIHYGIHLVPVPKVSIEYGADFNLQTIEGQGSFLELSGRTGLRNKNTFSGGELFGVDLKLGLEFNFSNNSRVTAYQVQTSTFLKIPRLEDFTNQIKFYRRLKLMNTYFCSNLYENGITKASLNFDLSNNSRLYNLLSIQGNFGHEVQLTTNKKQQIDLLGFTLFLTSGLSDNLKDLLRTQKYLQYSLGDQLMTGILFRKFQFQYRSVNANTNESYTAFGNLSTSGLEYQALKNLLGSGYKRTIQNYEKNPVNIQFSQFLKAEIDGRYQKHYSPQHSLLLRGSLGSGFSFGSSKEMPFVEQFSLGGPLSMRGWRIREIGPGLYIDSNAVAPFYQTGTFKFELNGEFRFPIFWIFKGALFIDAGNIWLLRKDEDRPGANLSLASLKSIGVNTGFGLRMDFTYFIFRLDAGSILKTTYELPSENGGSYKYRYPYKNGKEMFKAMNFNFALGYPF